MFTQGLLIDLLCDGVSSSIHDLLGLLVNVYTIGMFRLRKIERVTYENFAYKYIDSNLFPDYDTIANFRKFFKLYFPLKEGNNNRWKLLSAGFEPYKMSLFIWQRANMTL